MNEKLPSQKCSHSNHKVFDRSQMTYYPLSSRKNKVAIESSCVDPLRDTIILSEELQQETARIADEIVRARDRGASVMCAFGAHTIKNGIGQLLGRLAQQGWISHLATNGAGVIHDWEFAYLGQSSEDVRTNVQEGKFGTWHETGYYLNLALAVGAYEGLGYGESIGSMIVHNGLEIPTRSDLQRIAISSERTLDKRASALDLLGLVTELDESLFGTFLRIEHPYSSYSAQAMAWEADVPFTSHPMFGHDIIYTHKANRGAVIGRTAERDFLSYVQSVSNLEGGVYLSVGSAVMSPMIFEKSLSMVRNCGKQIADCAIHVVDLQEKSWDWSKGEPPVDNPAYYLRFMKTFSRMGCNASYTCSDNHAFFVSLYRELDKRS
ncbi:MAG: hypothetical protein VB127_03040 [Sphaerochaeta sp.]|jgi:hypothetical protein|nr:hypothetical protein [Sphaerochaeta sp.]